MNYTRKYQKIDGKKPFVMVNQRKNEKGINFSFNERSKHANFSNILNDSTNDIRYFNMANQNMQIYPQRAPDFQLVNNFRYDQQFAQQFQQPILTTSHQQYMNKLQNHSQQMQLQYFPSKFNQVDLNQSNFNLNTNEHIFEQQNRENQTQRSSKMMNQSNPHFNFFLSQTKTNHQQMYEMPNNNVFGMKKNIRPSNTFDTVNKAGIQTQIVQNQQIYDNNVFNHGLVSEQMRQNNPDIFHNRKNKINSAFQTATQMSSVQRKQFNTLEGNYRKNTVQRTFNKTLNEKTIQNHNFEVNQRIINQNKQMSFRNNVPQQINKIAHTTKERTSIKELTNSFLNGKSVAITGYNRTKNSGPLHKNKNLQVQANYLYYMNSSNTKNYTNTPFQEQQKKLTQLQEKQKKLHLQEQQKKLINLHQQKEYSRNFQRVQANQNYEYQSILNMQKNDVQTTRKETTVQTTSHSNLNTNSVNLKQPVQKKKKSPIMENSPKKIKSASEEMQLQKDNINIRTKLDEYFNTLFYARDIETILKTIEKIHSVKLNDKLEIKLNSVEDHKNVINEIIKKSKEMFIAYEEKISKDLSLFKFNQISLFLKREKVELYLFEYIRNFLIRLTEKAKSSLIDNGQSSDMCYGVIFDDMLDKFNNRVQKDGNFCIHLKNSVPFHD